MAAAVCVAWRGLASQVVQCKPLWPWPHAGTETYVRLCSLQLASGISLVGPDAAPLVLVDSLVVIALYLELCIPSYASLDRHRSRMGLAGRAARLMLARFTRRCKPIHAALPIAALPTVWQREPRAVSRAGAAGRSDPQNVDDDRQQEYKLVPDSVQGKATRPS